jgi:hypothetical protein
LPQPPQVSTTPRIYAAFPQMSLVGKKNGSRGGKAVPPGAPWSRPGVFDFELRINAMKYTFGSVLVIAF